MGQDLCGSVSEQIHAFEVRLYVASKGTLNQISEDPGGNSIRFVALSGRHMFYAQDTSRATLRKEVQSAI